MKKNMRKMRVPSWLSTCAFEIEGKPTRAADCRAHAALMLTGVFQARAQVCGRLQMSVVSVTVSIAIIQHDDACSFS
jgi:hypothetical protein